MNIWSQIIQRILEIFWLLLQLPNKKPIDNNPDDDEPIQSPNILDPTRDKVEKE
jgi:hypothetical protein